MTESTPTWHWRQMPRSGCGVTGTYAAEAHREATALVAGPAGVGPELVGA